mgnify:FL=1|uniref:Uncharacterized protein n=1 Tax=viral metagenome TaxID=1070528 RepID=A0A6C0AZD8_9ZZZZ|tara:strand:+ start:583 stop:1383 length:801 start_codon:yes stop_codon:yes gene_type:complete
MIKQPLNIHSNIENFNTMEQALARSGIPQSKLNELLKLFERRLTCDSDCQKEREIAKLKKKWEKSEAAYNKTQNDEQYYTKGFRPNCDSNLLLQNANEDAKKYYVADKGISFYRDNIEKRGYIEHINEFKTREHKKLDDMKEVINILLSNYTTATISSTRLNQLYSDLSNKNEKLKKDIDDYKKRVLTDGRKLYYQDGRLENLEFYKKVITILYFMLLVFYIFFGLFRDDQYKKWKVWFVITLYIVFPFVLRNIIAFVSNIYTKYS